MVIHDFYVVQSKPDLPSKQCGRHAKRAFETFWTVPPYLPLKDKITAGFESVPKKALNETAVRRVDEVVERLDALERKNG
jgi:hypothetical protein